MDKCIVCNGELKLINEGRHFGCQDCGTAFRADLTIEQWEVFVNCSHLTLASRLEDGDVLVLDENELFGPYVLTRDGKVQDVYWHYQKYHGRNS